MKKLISTLPEYAFLMSHSTGPDNYAVMLSKNGAYSVCQMQPRRRIALSPNYQANGHGLLTAPLTSAGLADLLQWTDYGNASARFRTLANLPKNVITLVPERRRQQ